MLFNSYIFLLLFLPVTLGGFYFLRHLQKITLSKVFLGIASLFFYAYFRPVYLFIIFSSIVVNYFLGHYLVVVSRCDSAKRKWLLVLGIIFNLGLLGVFKYLDFVIENINGLLGLSLPLLHILLPLGISFYTFQQLSYLLDTYKGKEDCKNFCDYVLFVTFFPQLVAGPIVLPQEMLPQFALSNSSSAQKAEEGLFLLGCGLVKKCFIADAIAVFPNVGFDSSTTLTCAEGWLVSIAYTMQLYFDFSGYCDMAMGIGKFFGIDLPLNFNSPYKSRNFQEFWRRWHITLGRFLMNYLYIPLGGNRKGEVRTLLNLLIVFWASGIWHGAGWTFILWGLLHGICILLHRLWKRWLAPALHFQIPGVVAWGVTFFFVNLFWVFFRANSLGRAMAIINSMFGFKEFYISRRFGIALGNGGLYSVNKLYVILLLACLVVFVCPSSLSLLSFLKRHKNLYFFTNIVLLVLGFLCVGQDSPFLYFNF